MKCSSWVVMLVGCWLTGTALGGVSSPVVINHRAGSEGKLFGSVTTAEIAEAIETQIGVVVDRKQLHLDEPIREVGTHVVPAKLHADVEFPVTVEVVGADA